MSDEMNDSNDKIRIKKSTIYIFGIIALMVLGFFVFRGGGFTGDVVKIGDDGSQIVRLGVSGGDYVFSPSTFKVGVPVRLEMDSSVGGCARSVVIPAFGIRQVISKDKPIEFTPDKTGTFDIACSMNMYRGTFKVTD